MSPILWPNDGGLPRLDRRPSEEIMLGLPLRAARAGRAGRAARAGRTARAGRAARTAAAAALGAIVVLGAGLAGPARGDAATLATAVPVQRIVGAPIALDQFQWFVGLTTDGRYLYAADRARIVKLDTDPTRAIASFDASALAPYLIKTPRSQYGVGSAVMAAGPTGVFVTDGTRITRIGSALDGTGIAQFGSEGTGVGQFGAITGMAVSRDWLYVADAGNHRVVRLPQTLDGSDWRTFGASGTGIGRFGKLAGVAATDLAVFVADAGNDRIVRLSPALDGTGWAEYQRREAGMYGTLQVKGQQLYIRSTDCTADLNPGVLRVAVSLTTSGAGCIRIAPTDVSVSARSFATDIAVTPSGTYVGTDAHDSGIVELRRLWPDSPSVADTYGRPAFGMLGQLAAPQGAVVARDTVYVCDSASAAPLAGTRIVALRRSDMTFVSQLEAPCSAGLLAADGDLVFASDGEKIFRYRGPDLAAAGTYGTEGNGRGGFSRIDALAAAAGVLYVADGGQGRVARLSADAFDGTGWKTVATGRFPTRAAFLGTDGRTLAMAVESKGSVSVSRIATSLGGTWRTIPLRSSGKAVTDVGGIDVDADRVYVTVGGVAGKLAPALLVLRASDLVTVGLGRNPRGSPPAAIRYPTGIAAVGGEMYIADGVTAPGRAGRRSDAAVDIWEIAPAP
jgi:hypothetical protein